VEKMMQGFYRAALVVRRISDRLLQRFEEQFDGEAQPEPLTVGFSLRRGYLAANEADYAEIRARHRNRGDAKRLVTLEHARGQKFQGGWDSYT
ncbi:hypothetical protein, partial [Pseudomonas syringae group genomosp. 7]|uniref:hypothetical protein n=1 Tax=Pseudomonas syringae group genomosp. 7 TaxID=251699 RepID=UPI00376F5A17